MNRKSFIMDCGNDQVYLLITEDDNPVYYHDYFPNGATQTQYVAGMKKMCEDAVDGVTDGIDGWEGNEIDDYVAEDFTKMLSYDGRWHKLEDNLLSAEDFVKINKIVA